MIDLKKILAVFCAISLIFNACEGPFENGKSGSDNEEVVAPGTNPDNPGTGEDPDPGTDPDNPGTGEDPDPGTDPDNPGTDPEPGDENVVVTVIDPGEKPSGNTPVYPQFPDLMHRTEANYFWSELHDYLDDFGNVDYVCSQGKGTSWPYITESGSIRFYQGSSSKDGGSYFRVRSQNGAKLKTVGVHSATDTKLAHTLNGKMKKSETKEVAKGTFYTVSDLGNCDEVCFYCMGTSASERWEMDSLFVDYQGGYVESDFYVPEKEYGPLVEVKLPFKEDFDKDFPTTDKPSYYKYGLTAGREHLEWSTWFGSFSWQNPIEGSQSVQLRVYQEDEEYIGEQFGHTKMEFFIKDLQKVSFKFYMSEFWMKATISYCEFGSTDWKNPQQIGLKNYSDRQTVQEFSYTLDGGAKHDAKIKIEIDPATGYPTRDHYDFICDSFVFE